MRKGMKSSQPVPKFMDPATYDAAPSTGVKNPVLAATPNARIYDIVAITTWTVQPTLEVWITIDGIEYRATFTNPVSNTPYYVVRSPIRTATADIFILTATQPIHAFLIEGRSVSITVESTGGTVSNLKCHAQYGKG